MVVNAKVQIEPATGIIMSYPFSIVPISGALMLMQQLMVMAVDLIQWNTDADPFEVRA
jgi:TRAP-type C4-dicarboxylate transport system permease small subunit